MSSRFLPILLTAVWLAGCAVAPPPDEAPSWDEVLALPPDQAWNARASGLMKNAH